MFEDHEDECEHCSCFGHSAIAACCYCDAVNSGPFEDEQDEED